MRIKPTDNDKEPSFFRISKERGRTYTVSYCAFLKHCGIPFAEGSKIYRANWDEKGKMILVKLG